MRRAKKAEAQLLGFCIIIGLPIYLGSLVINAVGPETLVILILCGVIFFILYKIIQNRSLRRQNALQDEEREIQYQKRKTSLLMKYSDSQIVEKILNKGFWQGQTSEQLLDSLGFPVDKEEKVLKTKTKEIWKYHPRGTNRYALRVTLENGRVVGWEQKE